MEVAEYTRIAFDRIQKMEPEHVSKIIGFILLHDQGDQKIARLAEASDQELHDIVSKATAELQSLATRSCAMMSQATEFHRAERILYDEDLKWTAGNYLSSTKGVLDSPSIMEPMMNSSYFPSDYFHEDKHAYIRRSIGRQEFPVKTCHYFNKGFCKHGLSCRYYHGQVNVESMYQMYGNGNEGVNDGHVLSPGSPGSLAQLEAELVELLRPRNGDPLAITSLPMVYYERFKKPLLADGYLTESQRYGKTGFSLTKLLARLKNSIRLIDRADEQHAVILAEYAPKYFKYQSNEKIDTSQNASASRQIYLTFPADSIFTEEDVSDYFSTFGCVEDVRIPCQQRRMFGFVTFSNAYTVKAILEKGNPHNLGGSRVLVKPYREKAKLIDHRKLHERIEQSIQYSSEYIDLHRKHTPLPRQQDTPRLFLSEDRMNDQEQALEFEMKQLAILKLTQKSPSYPSYFGYSQDGLRSFHEGEYVEDANNGVDDKQRGEDVNNSTDQDSQLLNLPDSPFSVSGKYI